MDQSSNLNLSFDVLVKILVATGNPKIFLLNSKVTGAIKSSLYNNNKYLLSFLIGKYGMRSIIFRIWAFINNKNLQTAKSG